MHIEFTKTPTNDDIDFITYKLNEEAPKEYGRTNHFAFFIRSNTNKIIAGCSCFALFGVIYIDQLWVAPRSRRIGLGRKIMQQVHEYGRKNNFAISVVQTMSFRNAQLFYEKLGYKTDYERKEHASGASCIFMSIKL